jgi:Ca2+/H+ antiporter
LLVVPVVTLLSLLFTHPLALAFRWSELLAMAGAAAVATAVVWNGHSSRREGVLLVVAYAAVVAGFYIVGGT